MDQTSGLPSRTGVTGDGMVLDLRESPSREAPVTWSPQLQGLAQALVRAVSIEDVTAAVFSYGRAAAGAHWAHIAHLVPEGSAVTCALGGQGLPLRRWRDPASGEPAPWDSAMREGSILVFDTMDAVSHEYPSWLTANAVPSVGAVVTAPLNSGGRGQGAVTFGFQEPGPVPPATLAMIDQVATLTAKAARRALRYEAEHHAADILQRAYLPEPAAHLAGISVACRYLPADTGGSVGGDWYDAFALPGSRVALIVGDVAGHGLRAATVMGSLRSALRAYALFQPSPGEMLTRLNVYACTFKPDVFATALAVVVDPGDGLIRFARAGHPPFAIAAADRPAELVADPAGPPLGIPGTRYHDGEHRFEVGDCIVLYTDGLIERRDASIDDTVGNLLEASNRGAPTPGDLCDRLTRKLLGGIELFDDTAVLVARRESMSTIVS